MAAAIIEGQQVEVTGKAACVGGKHPDPPLDRFPLLAWCPAQPIHGSMVFTEDGAATVHDIAVASSHTQSFEALAEQFGTTTDHVDQALSYATKAGFFKE